MEETLYEKFCSEPQFIEFFNIQMFNIFTSKTVVNCHRKNLKTSSQTEKIKSIKTSLLEQRITDTKRL